MWFKLRDMLKITNPWIFLIIGFVLIVLSTFTLQELIFASVIAFVLSLYFASRDYEKPKQVEFNEKIDFENS